MRSCHKRAVGPRQARSCTVQEASGFDGYARLGRTGHEERTPSLQGADDLERTVTIKHVAMRRASRGCSDENGINANAWAISLGVSTPDAGTYSSAGASGIPAAGERQDSRTR
jgi:hypothetical protein